MLLGHTQRLHPHLVAVSRFFCKSQSTTRDARHNDSMHPSCRPAESEIKVARGTPVIAVVRHKVQ